MRRADGLADRATGSERTRGREEQTDRGQRDRRTNGQVGGTESERTDMLG